MLLCDKKMTAATFSIIQKHRQGDAFIFTYFFLIFQTRHVNNFITPHC